MNCKKCNGKIIDGCCTKCGYLNSGNKIISNETDKNEDLKLFNKDFNIISENKNLLLVFLLGPIYFSYRGYFFLGTILGIVDYLIFYYIMNALDVFVFILGGFGFAVAYILINRVLYIIFSNYLCILIDKFKVKRIKKKYKENYKNELKYYKHNKWYLLITIIIYIILILIFVIYKRIKNGLL